MIAAMDVASFERDGYAVARGFIAPELARALHERALALDASGALAAAAVGRGGSRARRPEVRGDRIAWLDDASPSPVEQPLLDALATLRERLNAALYLGLWDFEAHYALYPPGASYARHRDRFRGERPGAPSRVVSFVLYLNERWRASEGGALRLHLDEGYVDVLPDSGKLVCFLADRFEHEVLPATRPRVAVTGWFRRREVGSDSTFS